MYCIGVLFYVSINIGQPTMVAQPNVLCYGNISVACVGVMVRML